MNRNDIKFIEFDTLARQLKLQVEKEGGYNPELEVVVITVDNPFGTKKDGVYRIDGDEAGDIGRGKVFEIDSNKLSITDDSQGYYVFRDGVLNLNYYASNLEIQIEEGLKGTNWLIGTGLQAIIDNYDSVIIGTEVYEILKTEDYPSNAGTIIYLDRDLTEDVTEVYVAERSNLKVFNNNITKTTIARGACIMADPLYRNNGILEKQNGVLKVIRNNEASRILFERGDYSEADRLLRDNVEIGRFLNLI